MQSSMPIKIQMCCFNSSKCLLKIQLVKRTQKLKKHQVWHPLLKRTFYSKLEGTIVKKVNIQIKKKHKNEHLFLFLLLKRCFNCKNLQNHRKTFEEICSFPCEVPQCLKKFSSGDSLMKHNKSFKEQRLIKNVFIEHSFELSIGLHFQ
jgi:hypothetical protein